MHSERFMNHQGSTNRKTTFFRREQIYPFRSITFYGLHIEWKNVENWDPLPSNEPRMFTDVSERINPFPTNTLESIPLGELAKLQFV